MRRWLLFALALAACGRLRFDTIGDGSGSDGNGSDAAVAPALAITEASYNGCAVDAAGALWCWGDNYNGQRGDGGPAAASQPLRIGSDTWLSVSAGGISDNTSTTCALRSDHTVWCWGEGADGQLGNGIAASSNVPVEAGSDTWSKVSVGIECDVCAIRASDSSLWCWGDDPNGNCGGYVGDGGTADVLSPVQIAPGVWTDVSVGDVAGCAVRADGTLWCWGNNRDLAAITSVVPAQLGTDTTWRHIAIGEAAGCGVHVDGSLSCFGRNFEGALGDGTMTESVAPETIYGTWTDVATSGYSTCAIAAGSGALYCWGDPTEGTYGTTGTTPVLVPTLVDSGVWTAVSLGLIYNTCGIRNGVAVCAGADGSAQLGRDAGSQRMVPEQLDGPWTAIAGGAEHGCALAGNGTLSCWGYDGGGTFSPGIDDQQPNAIGGPWSAPIIAGDLSQCVSSSGTLSCWGSLFGSTAPAPPTAYAGYTTLSLGSSHACGLQSDQTMWCWGDNQDGELGNPAAGTSSVAPVQVNAMTWKSVAAGDRYTCGVATTGTLWCWGFNAELESGQPGGNPVTTPAQVGSGTSWSAVFSGALASSACAQDTTGALYCWGYDGFGQLGDAGTTSSAVPIQITSATDWTKVGVGVYHACGLRSGVVWCWGSNAPVGNGTGIETAPIAVTGPGFIDLAVQGVSTCALDASGMRWCWGDNVNGDLGDGRAWATSFVPVALQ